MSCRYRRPLPIIGFCAVECMDNLMLTGDGKETLHGPGQDDCDGRIWLRTGWRQRRCDPRCVEPRQCCPRCDAGVRRTHTSYGYSDTPRDPFDYAPQDPYGNATPDPYGNAAAGAYNNLPQNPIPQPQQTTYMPRTAQSQPRYESRDPYARQPYREYPSRFRSMVRTRKRRRRVRRV